MNKIFYFQNKKIVLIVLVLLVYRILDIRSPKVAIVKLLYTQRANIVHYLTEEKRIFTTSLRVLYRLTVDQHLSHSCLYLA